MSLIKKNKPQTWLCKQIMFEDDFLIIIDKPQGVVVNRSETSPKDTLQDFIEEKYPKTFLGESEFAQRSGIVHRLDKDTSGVIIGTKTEEAFNHIKKQFQNREVKKEYLAVVIGEFTDAKVRVEAPIKRSPKNRLKMGIDPSGREAVTNIELEKNFEKEGEKFTLLRVYPETGRTHQIRVHLAALKFPIVGDKIYSTSNNMAQLSGIFDRLMLHSKAISFVHPDKKEPVNFEAPIPKEFSEL
ncbi:RluA family pseudouridine synthase [Patescibacteria group bacterium]